MKILERVDTDWIKLMIDKGELQEKYDQLSTSDIKYQIGLLLDET
jgi:hypothetical protein